MAANEKRIKRRIRNAYIVSTVSIALVLFIVGAVGYLIMNARQASDRLRENITMSVLLKDDVTAADRKDIFSKLSARTEVKEIKYISKDDAAEEFKEYIGNDFVGFLEENPLPASYEISLNAEYSDVDTLKKFEREIVKLTGVEDVIYQEAIIGQITANIQKFNLLLLLFGCTLLAISLILINNTIRMAIFSKRFIINTMKLVGATRFFIIKPFISRALLQGIYAGIISSVMIGAMVYGLSEGIPEAGFLIGTPFLLTMFGLLFAGGIVISILFTFGAVLKYVNLSTNKLHLY